MSVLLSQEQQEVVHRIIQFLEAKPSKSAKNIFQDEIKRGIKEHVNKIYLSKSENDTEARFRAHLRTIAEVFHIRLCNVVKNSMYDYQYYLELNEGKAVLDMNVSGKETISSIGLSVEVPAEAENY